MRRWHRVLARNRGFRDLAHGSWLAGLLFVGT